MKPLLVMSVVAAALRSGEEAWTHDGWGYPTGQVLKRQAEKEWQGLISAVKTFLSRRRAMADDQPVKITETLTIPLSELHFQFSRSSGPGGQHVNRSATQVELTFDVANSSSLNEAQRARILSALKTYIDSRGTLHLSAQTTRSQHRNRAEVIERFQRILQRALHIPKRRVPTRPPPQVKEQRLSEKRRTSIVKEGRTRKRPEPD